MMMRLLFLVLLTAICGGCGGQQSDQEEVGRPVAQASALPDPGQPVDNPFPDATELRLFVETGNEPDGTPIMSKPAGAVLTQEQRADFEATLRARTPPEEVVGCFIPHHFFRYFNAAGEQIGEIQVCFCCGGVRGNVGVAAGKELSVDYGKLEELVTALGEPVDILCGDEG